ncbi:MAG: stage II sporulation protein M [Candidatus Norongarragalinales archaeon]
MVLEYIVSPSEAKRKPWELAVVSFLFVSFGVLTQMLIPSLQGSVIIFALIPLIPLFFFILLRDEAEEEHFDTMKEEIDEWKKVLKELKDEQLSHLSRFALLQRFKRIINVHKTMIELFGFVFLGAILAYTFWFSILPQQQSYDLFYSQLQEIRTLRAVITAQVFSAEKFEFLLTHNVQVLALMFLFSLLYGIGALYLLLWNASIIGVILGEKLVQQGMLGVLVGFLSLIPHGIFEITSYLVAALAGGVLSIAILRSSNKKPFFKYLIEDVAFLTILSLALLAIGAVVEAYY